MIIKDRRTPEQKKTHFMAIVGRDDAMSGWGQAQNGFSRAAWAFEIDKVNDARLFNNIRRKGLKYVNLVDLRDYRPPRGTAHFSIYVVTPDHPLVK